MRGDQSSSDPLPYTQVDRSAKPKATLVAGSIGCSPQHALGSLIEYWDLNGDPRELERILLKTPPGEKPAVVITAEQASARFRIASGGKELPADAQVCLGILEQREDGHYRVRGMSRYFEPVAKRIASRQAAAAGGKASAEKRRELYGTAQPPGGRGSKNRSDLGSDDRSVVASDALRTASEPEPKREPNRNRSGDRSGTEADPKPSGQRSEDRSNLLPSEEGAPRNPPPLELVGQSGPKPRKPSPGERFWERAQDKRCTRAGLIRDAKPDAVVLNTWYGRAVKELGSEERLWTGFLHYFEHDDYWIPQHSPFDPFMTEKVWRKHCQSSNGALPPPQVRPHW